MGKFLLTTALTLVAGSVIAQEVTEAPVGLTGKIETVIAEGASGDWGATSSFDLGVSAGSGLASGSMSFVVDSNNDLALDEYSIGTQVGGTELSFGDQGNIWIDTENGSSIEEAKIADESVQATILGVSLAAGLNMDDLTDIQNVQAGYGIPLGIANINAVADYNLNSEAWIVAGRADTDGMLENVRVGGAVSYGSVSETLGFEADATVGPLTGYIGGDQNDLMKDAGVNGDVEFAGMDVETKLNYNFDSKEITPSVGLSFNF